MKNLLWIMISSSLFTLSAAHGAAILAGPVYNPTTTHSYFLLTSSDWTDAEAAAVNMGGHLATVNDTAENDWIVSTFSNFGGQPRALWIGLNDAQQEGTFVWSSGEPVTYTHWEAGQPDNGSGFYPYEDYVMIWPSPGSRSPGYWNDLMNTNGIVNFNFQIYGVVEITTLNNWTGPTSGKWESSTNWSLGKLPASNQVVNIGNPGYKAVGIDSTTVANFPNSLTNRSLDVSAPTNSLNTLLLNYFGVGTPLKVLSSCWIGTNGILMNLFSSFDVGGSNGGALTIDGGTFSQDGGATVVNGSVTVLNNGIITATNGNLTLGTVTIGAAPSSFGAFIQDGGSVLAQQINVANFALPAPLLPWPEPSGYELFSGVLYALNGTTCSAFGPAFRQYGGTNYGDITVTQSLYELFSGTVHGNVLTLASPDGNAGLFGQEGGLIEMQFINVSAGSTWPPQEGPGFSGGAVHCGTLTISNNARVEMGGADFVITNNLDLHGGGQGPLIQHAVCVQSAGNVYLPSMSLGQYAYFDLMGGSNEISGGLSVAGGQYSMYGGTLETTNTGVGAAATFVHLGGQHLVHGVLAITGTYGLSDIFEEGGCNVVCQGLYLRGALTMTLNFNGHGFDPPATITNTGVLNLGGSIRTELPDAALGQVQLATNATIDLSARFSAVVRFANSSAVGWTAGALLVITNWSSSDHVFAGSDASGLSASQLQQVRFVNPSGFAPGAYPAQILSTGEIVPGQRPALAAARMPNALVLTWPGNYQLLSSTNVAGPYLPVSGATSPRTNFFTAPHQFFRLRSAP